MLYKFKSQAAAEVIMLQSSAEELLKIIGKAPGATGIITVEQIPAAIAALRQAVAESEAAEKSRAEASAAPDGEGDDEEADEPVLPHQLVAPFVRLLEASAAEGKAVVWGVWKPPRGLPAPGGLRRGKSPPGRVARLRLAVQLAASSCPCLFVSAFRLLRAGREGSGALGHPENRRAWLQAAAVFFAWRRQ